MMRRIISLLQLTSACRHVLFGLLATKRASNNHVAQVERFTFQRSLPPLDNIAPIGDDDQDYDYARGVPVVYTNSLGVAQRWVEDNLYSFTDEPRIVGWDMESSQSLPWLEDKYTSKTYFGPATIQLSTASNTLVFQLAQDHHGPIHKEGLPNFLCDLLEDPSIVPTGVGIDEDLVELYRWCDGNFGYVNSRVVEWASKPLTRFDIGKIGAPGGSTIGLARLVAGVLGVRLAKSNKLARTHWSRVPLRSKEVDYAARDAWAAASIVHRLGVLDPERFSPQSISNRLREEQRQTSIEKVSDRAAKRRAVKMEWKELKYSRDNQEDESSSSPKQWTRENKDRFDFLTQELKALAPMQPIVYEVTESLGINIP